MSMQQKLQIKPYNRLSRSGMNNLSSALGKSVQRLALAVCGAVVAISCSAIKTVPVETRIETVKRDSVVVVTKDSVVVRERTVNQTYTGFLDTLRISNDRARMEAWVDTSRNILAGNLEMFPTSERHQTNQKQELVYRDSVRVQQVPVPVEVVKQVTPAFWRVTGCFGIFFLLCILLTIVLKIIKIFKK